MKKKRKPAMRIGDEWFMQRQGASSLCVVQIISNYVKTVEIVERDRFGFWCASEFVAREDVKFIERIGESR